MKRKYLGNKFITQIIQRSWSIAPSVHHISPGSSSPATLSPPNASRATPAPQRPSLCRPRGRCGASRATDRLRSRATAPAAKKWTRTWDGHGKFRQFYIGMSWKFYRKFMEIHGNSIGNSWKFWSNWRVDDGWRASFRATWLRLLQFAGGLR